MDGKSEPETNKYCNLTKDEFEPIYQYATDLQLKYGIGKRFVELLYLHGYQAGKEDIHD